MVMIQREKTETKEEQTRLVKKNKNNNNNIKKTRNKNDAAAVHVNPSFTPPITAEKTERKLEAARSSINANQTVVEGDQWDVPMVAEYGDEIFEYMRSIEEQLKPNASYMDDQKQITCHMRSQLIDWLVDVHDHFKLRPESLFLAVNFLDRYLSCKNVPPGKLQLVGGTALFIAVKCEEGQALSVQDIVEISDNDFIADDVFKAERSILSRLEYNLGWPGPLSFLCRISNADNYEPQTRALSKYFLDVTVMDIRFVKYVPSLLSAGSYCLARFMLKKGDWVYLRRLRC
jgi:G2/mitotic-specific cyclin 3/4